MGEYCLHGILSLAVHFDYPIDDKRTLLYTVVMFKIIQRFIRGIIVGTAISFTGLFCMLTWFLYGIHFDSRKINTEVAFWLPHSFATQNADFTSLKNNIKDINVTNLYFHVGPLDEQGNLANDLHINRPELESLPSQNFAWIGALRSQINLDNEAVRAQIIKSAKWTISQGFDGVHLDIEPIRADDMAFTALLKELSTALPDVKLSIAIDEWQPHFLTKQIAQIYDTKIESYWTRDQIKSADLFVDQIVVMTYDTGFHDPALYAWWVETQTIALSKIVSNNTELFVGIPVYESGSSFDPIAENLQTGLNGFLRALQNIRSNIKNIAGIAIYPYWETDEAELAILNSL